MRAVGGRGERGRGRRGMGDEGGRRRVGMARLVLLQVSVYSKLRTENVLTEDR